MEAEWTYDSMRTANFDNAWLTVKDAILDKFAGPPDTGIYSPSVQHTLYQAEKIVLEKVPEVTIFFDLNNTCRVISLCNLLMIQHYS